MQKSTIIGLILTLLALFFGFIFNNAQWAVNITLIVWAIIVIANYRRKKLKKKAK
jgi:flagellar motor component MotA